MEKKIIASTLSVFMGLSFCLTGCSNQATETQAQSENHKIGVVVYDTTDDEVNMFRDYYKNYLEEAFPVEFFYSSNVSSVEDEKDFIDTAREEGCEGIISFAVRDLKEAVDYCGDDLYYAVGTASVDESAFNEVKDNKQFLGVIGPSSENETDAGVNMIQNLAGDNGSEKTYLLLSGGSAQDNYMHLSRLTGMVETLESEYGFTLEVPVEELSTITENTLVATSREGGAVYVCPGYYYTNEEVQKEIEEALKSTQPDVLASTMGIHVLEDTIASQEELQNKNIEVGTIDCFSENNQTLFETKDMFGNSSLDYIEGKCEAMAAPAFVAMYNAITGYAEVVKDNGSAYSLHQGFWSADNLEDYKDLRVKAENIYQNVYSTEDLMKTMAIYTSDANFESFKNLVEGL
jgi:hypothetical protein